MLLSCFQGFKFEALVFTLASIIRVARRRYQHHSFDNFCMYSINVTDLHTKWNIVTYDRHPRVGCILQVQALWVAIYTDLMSGSRAGYK